MVRSLIAGTILLLSAAAHAQMPAVIEARLPPPHFRVYVIAVCAAAEEVNDYCMNEGRRNSAYALAEMYLRAYRGQYVFNALRVRFPFGWVEVSQTRFLREIELQAIALASGWIARETASSSQERLQNWQGNALAEAASGSNWSHDWREYSHDFAPVHVTRQLADAELRR